jgi:hypothetical protein
MFKILDFTKFIKENNCKEVTNIQSFNKDMSPTPDGLYSTIIFGSTKQEQFEKFGYVNLGAKILHPLMHKNIGMISGLFKKVLAKEIKVEIKNGLLVESENGFTGIKELYNNWDNIKFKLYDEKNSKVKDFIEYLSTNKKDHIFIDKMIVIPINFRPAVQKNGLIHEDEISGLYKALIGYNDKERLSSEFMQSIMQMTDKTSLIQKKVNDIYNFFIDYLDKKDGLFRTSLIGKRVNNVARLVASARPDVPLNCVVLPWHACLNIFDLAIIGMINKDPYGKDYVTKLGLKDLSPDDLADLFGFIYHNVDIYTKNDKSKVELWQNLILDTFEYHEELRCFLKRDPAWDKGSYHLLKPVINTDNEYNCIINGVLYNPLGGDSFYSNYTTKTLSNNILVKNNNAELRVPGKECYIIKSITKIYEAI